MILDEIVSIKKVGMKETIDITIDGDHLFYCNNILTSNSGAGDTNEISEENIQGGISKIQSADNVLAFIPNSGARDVGLLKAKWLKSRDSGAVGKYIMFKIDWSTLSFNPTDNPGDHSGNTNTPTINIAGKGGHGAKTVTKEDGTEAMAPAKKGGKKLSGSSLRGNKKKVISSAKAVKNDDTAEDDDEPRAPKAKVQLKTLGTSIKRTNKNPKMF